ncbi:SPX domain-containing protein [Limtongia smithiae]|uniref:SPX domain-containing protein n=1 Tax=Limtongia smithiae TaxID=1125753 RepID=UPI0034CFC591
MKFSKVFQQLLDEEQIPSEWRPAAIQYKALKKCISKVVAELNELGLEKDTLSLLLAYERAQRDATAAAGADIVNGVFSGSSASTTPDHPALVYSFEGTLAHFVPKITIALDPDNGIPVDAQISPDTRAKLVSLLAAADGAGHPGRVYISDDSDAGLQPDDDDADVVLLDGTKRKILTSGEIVPAVHTPRDLLMPVTSSSSSDSCESIESVPRLRRFPTHVEIHLHSDSEFFHMLTTELEALDSLHDQQQRAMKGQVLDLARQLAHVSNPLQKKNDLYVWREIFRLYLDAGVFFSSLEQDHGERSADRAKQQLIWFTDQIRNMDLLSRFKLEGSKELFRAFWQLNMDVLQSTQFLSINRTATTKILKKFDKQTALSAQSVFPSFYFSAGPSATTSIAKAVCFAMADQLMSVVPQLDDYVCPVCYLIAFKPVRLDCGHVFCIRCLVKLQRQGKNACPICRRNVLLTADAGNLDIGMYNQMKLYFPKEVKAKQAANDKEVISELRKDHQQLPKCCIQ